MQKLELLCKIFIKSFDAHDNELFSQATLIEKINGSENLKNAFEKIGKAFLNSQQNKWTLHVFSSCNPFFKISQIAFGSLFEIGNENCPLEFLGVEVISQAHKNEPTSDVAHYENDEMFTFQIKRFSILLSRALSPKENGDPEKPVKPNHNYFFSGYYKTYLLQLKNKMEEIGKKYADVSDEGLNRIRLHLQQLDPNEPEKLRDGHSALLDHIRSFFRQDSVSDPLLEIKRELADWIFTGPQIEEFGWNLLLNYMPRLKKVQNLEINLLQDIQHHLEKHPKLRHLETCHETDFHRLGNLPAFVWEFGNYKGSELYPTKFIRTPCVVFREGLSYAVQPELEVFIKKAEAEKKQILYINLMDLQEGSFEYHLSRCLHSLDENGSPNFKVVSFDRNKRISFSKVSEIIEAILAKCKWSTKLNLEKWIPHCKRVIDEIHLHYFNQADHFTDLDAAIFLEIACVFLLDELITAETPDYCLITCHAGADRGPSFYTLLRLLHLLYDPSIKPEEKFQKIFGLLFSNAILSQNRPPHWQRVAIFQHAAELLLNRPILRFV